MEITYLGQSSYKIKTKDLSLVINPVDKVNADVVLYTGKVLDAVGERLTITGPGEYELSGVNIFGISTGEDNTMYSIEFDGAAVLHCGMLNHALEENILEKLDEITVLMIPLEGIKAISSIEPAYVVPLAQETDLGRFFKEMGVESASVSRVSTLKVSSADNELETSVVVLEKA